MKNISFLRGLFLINVVVWSGACHLLAMEPENADEDEIAIRQKLEAKEILTRILSRPTSERFKDTKQESRDFAAQVLDLYFSVREEQAVPLVLNADDLVPDAEYTFSTLIDEIVNRYRLTKVKDSYKAYPLSESRPGRK